LNKDLAMPGRIGAVRLEIDLSEEIQRCRRCAEAMRIFSKSQDAEGRNKALALSRQYDRIAVFLDDFKMALNLGD